MYKDTVLYVQKFKLMGIDIVAEEATLSKDYASLVTRVYSLCSFLSLTTPFFPKALGVQWSRQELTKKYSPSKC